MNSLHLDRKLDTEAATKQKMLKRKPTKTKRARVRADWNSACTGARHVNTAAKKPIAAMLVCFELWSHVERKLPILIGNVSCDCALYHHMRNRSDVRESDRE